MLLKGLSLFFLIGVVLSQTETESKVGSTEAEEVIDKEEDDLVCKYTAPDIGDVEITYQTSEEGFMVMTTVPEEIADPKEKLNACIAEEEVQGRKSQKNRPNAKNQQGNRKNKNRNRNRINNPTALLQRTRNLIKGNPSKVTVSEMRAVIRNAQQFIKLRTNQKKKNNQRRKQGKGKDNNRRKQAKENTEEVLVE